MQGPIRGIVEKVRSSHAPCTVFEYPGRRARWFRWTMLSLRSLIHSFPFLLSFLCWSGRVPQTRAREKERREKKITEVVWMKAEDKFTLSKVGEMEKERAVQGEKAKTGEMGEDREVRPR